MIDKTLLSCLVKTDELVVAGEMGDGLAEEWGSQFALPAFAA